MSNKSKVEEMEDALNNGQTTDNTELNDENRDMDQNEGQEEKVSVEDKLRQDLAQEKDKFLRLFAEFENFKKRYIPQHGGKKCKS